MILKQTFCLNAFFIDFEIKKQNKTNFHISNSRGSSLQDTIKSNYSLTIMTSQALNKKHKH